MYKSVLSNANIVALATLPGTPTYRLPVTSGMGAPDIRVEANRFNADTSLQLRARGCVLPVTLVAPLPVWP